MKLAFLEEGEFVRQVPLDPVGTTIGRGTTADLVLLDPRASRQHCRIVHASGIWLVEDLGSTNGMTVNGTRIVRPQVLQPGDKLGVGNSLLVFLEDHADATSALWLGDIPSTVRIPVPWYGDPRAETQKR
jgi:pSer/pThr/pTyr-binding forkhead associated (FHA) protein